MGVKQDKIYIYGKHALEEAIKNAPFAIDRVFLSSQAQSDKSLTSILSNAGIQPSKLSQDDISARTEKGAVHQGVIGRISLSKLVRPYSEFIMDFLKGDKPRADTALALLGELEDPQNVGAIIRSAAGFGISAVLIPEHNQAPVTGSVIKVSAGMAFRVPLVSIGNVNDTIRDLKKKGFWIYGLAGEGEKSVNEEDFSEASVFVLGNESKGIREKTREACDMLIKIPMNPKCESLNVAASAAVVFHDWSIRHPGALDNI